jgi:hypothetical protein
MRLKSDIWVQAYLRICAVQGIAAVMIRRGDADAGAIYIRVNHLDGRCSLYGPAASGMAGNELDRRFSPCHDRAALAESEADTYLNRQIRYDSDLWIIELEDRKGRHCLGDWLVPG